MDSASRSSDDNSNSWQVPDQQQHPPHRKCPRCDSNNTKFCYYNNYSHSQPRYFCKTCRRYWTHGGTLRNVPVGGGCRKNKRARTSLEANDTTFGQRLPPAAVDASRDFTGRIPAVALRPVIPPMGNYLYPAGGIGQLNFGGAVSQFGGNLLGLPAVKPQAAAARLLQAPMTGAFPPVLPRSLNSWAQRGGGGSVSSSAGGFWSCGGDPAAEENQLSENHLGINQSE